jgi:uncharacterized protein YehS (DUF1456 family)
MDRKELRKEISDLMSKMNDLVNELDNLVYRKMGQTDRERLEQHFRRAVCNILRAEVNLLECLFELKEEDRFDV